VFRLTEYAFTLRGGSWPAGECLVRDPTHGEPIAVVRDEPWPEVLERAWPDGARGRPWLFRLLGVERYPRQSRTVVRRCGDGQPLVRLHHRQPLFQRTVGVFDGEDRRVGYCRWAFKGTGPRDEFAVLRTDHSPACEVRAAGQAEYCVSGVGVGPWAVVAMSGRGPGVAGRVALTPAAPCDGPEAVLLLAAVVVLFQLAGVG
jgi:hypothetical protein